MPSAHGSGHHSKHNYLHLYTTTEQAIYNCLTVSITHTSPHQYIPPFDHGEASGSLQPPLNPPMSSPAYIDKYVRKTYVLGMLTIAKSRVCTHLHTLTHGHTYTH